MKLQIWSVDHDGNPDDLLDETDVSEDEFQTARNNGQSAMALLNDLHLGRNDEN